MHVLRGRCSYKTVAMEVRNLNEGVACCLLLVCWVCTCAAFAGCFRFNDRVKKDILGSFDDVVLVVTVLSGTEKRVPWVTVQVLRLPVFLMLVSAPRYNCCS